MSKESSILRCPSCGAPASAEAARCEYCRARLATVSCPSCFALLLDGVAYCPHCGTARSRSEGIDAQTTKCPACTGAMRWVRVGNIDLLECDACDGTWLEAATFERLCADRESQAAVVHRTPEQSAPASKPPEQVRYRPCPRCGKMMNRLNFGRLSGAVVDVCRGHGTFLDRGELHQVIRFIQQGGMDRARELQREQLRDEERRVRDAQYRQAQMTPSEHPPFAWNPRWLHDLLMLLFGRA